MYVTLATLLCLGAAVASGAVLPRGPRYTLVLPLGEQARYQLATGDLDTEQYSPQALVRVRRQLAGSIDFSNTGGTTLQGSLSQNLFTSQNGMHKVDGDVHASRSFNIPGVGTGPLTHGVGVNYQHLSRGGAGVSVDRNVAGTHVNLSGRATVWESDNGRHSVGAYGNYARSYGGMHGTGAPSYGGGGTYTYRFG